MSISTPPAPSAARLPSPMLMRSKLFVPASRSELFGKAAASQADALSFDLEDAVAPDRKGAARTELAAYLQGGNGRTGKLIVVRINGHGTPWFDDDLRLADGGGIDLINLPVVEDSAVILAVARRLEEMGATGTAGQPTGLLINIETPKGLRKAAELACAHPKIAGLQIGYADLFEPTGIDRSDGHALAHVRLTIRLAAAEAGIAAFDGAYPVVKNPDGFLAECLAARNHGFAGKSCIHPSQVALANSAFTPTTAEIDQARRVLAAAEEAERQGVGAYVVDGQMIDAPFLLRARAIVTLADTHPSTGGTAE